MRHLFKTSSFGLPKVCPFTTQRNGQKFLLALGLGIAFAGCSHNPEKSSNASATIKNSQQSQLSAIQSHDKAVYVKSGWMRDPYIYLADDGYYYLTGTTPQPNDPREMSDKYNTGLDHPDLTGKKEPSIVGRSIRVWRSENLVDWESLGSPFTLDKGFWKKANPKAFDNTPKPEWKVWAPEMYKINGEWVFIHTSPSPVKGGANLAIGQNGDMNGEYASPMKRSMKGKHDPSLFLDDDGTWYLLWGNTKIAPIKPGFKGLAAKAKRIDPSDRIIGHEGATLRKIGDKYVHFGTAWSTDKLRKGSYNLYYSTADNITGPYGPRQFAGRFLGHGTPFQDKKGRWWCTAFFNGNVPPINDANIQNRDLGDTAQTINEQGTTLVPLDVKVLPDGEIYIRAKDPRYAVPGPDEAQSF